MLATDGHSSFWHVTVRSSTIWPDMAIYPERRSVASNRSNNDPTDRAFVSFSQNSQIVRASGAHDDRHRKIPAVRASNHLRSVHPHGIRNGTIWRGI